jgi:hypothetical protein
MARDASAFLACLFLQRKLESRSGSRGLLCAFPASYIVWLQPILQLCLGGDEASSVNGHHRSSHPLSPLAREPEAGGGYVFGLADTLEGERAGNVILHGLEGRFHHLGAERTKGEGVDGDQWAKLGGEVLGHAVLSGRDWAGGGGAYWCKAALEAEYAYVSSPGTPSPLTEPI